MKISIVTVTYNSEKTLRDTIDSVLAQTYSDIEYILVDGLSTDNTVQIIQEYESKFGDRMRWISERDNGLYDAMNKGIQMCTGEVVGTLNSDDFFTSNEIIQKIANEFVLNLVDAVYGDVHYVKTDNLDKCIRYYSSRIFERKLMKLGFMPAHPTFYIRKSCYELYGFYKVNYKICADFDLMLRFIYVNNVVTKYIPCDMVTMRTGGLSTKGMNSHIQIMKEHLRSFKENNVRSNMFFLSVRYLYKVTEYIF